MGASMSRTVTITLTALLATLAAGCSTTTVTKEAAPTQSPPTASPSPSPTASEGGKVGETFTVTTSDDQKYDVTLLGVDQPAQPQSEYASVKAGHHLAAAQFRVTAITHTEENANNNATVTGSNEQAYTSSFEAVTAGTNFANGQILLQPGSSLVGWVSFELPDGVRVAKVQWTPSAGLATRNAEWAVNSSAAPSPSPTPTSPTTSTATATATPTATSSDGAVAPGAADPRDTVNAYFDAINSRDFQKAWSLGGKNTGSTYSQFVSGFETTSMVSVDILDVSGDSGTGVVTARLTTLETGGTTKVFQGTYTVKNGVITKFDVHQVG
jgi:hypothetical protein